MAENVDMESDFNIEDENDDAGAQLQADLQWHANLTDKNAGIVSEPVKNPMLLTPEDTPMPELESESSGIIESIPESSFMPESDPELEADPTVFKRIIGDISEKNIVTGSCRKIASDCRAVLF